MGKTIKLTEDKLRKIVTKNVRKFLMERTFGEKGMSDMEVTRSRNNNFADDMDRNDIMRGGPGFDGPTYSDSLEKYAMYDMGITPQDRMRFDRYQKHIATQNHNRFKRDFEDDATNAEVNDNGDKYYQDALEAIEMSDGNIDFQEWYPAFYDELEDGEAEEIFNRAMNAYNNNLNESKIKKIVAESVRRVLKEGRQFMPDRNYTHYALNKATNKIVNGWDYRGYEPSELRQFKKDYFDVDLMDMEMNPRDYKIVTKQFLLKNGIDPQNWENWSQN